MSATRVVAAVVTAAALIGAPPSAAASDIIGLLQVDIDGVSAEAAAEFERRIEDGLGNAGFDVATRERLDELLSGTDYIDGCVLGPCLNEVFRNTEVRLVLVARITGVGHNYSFVATLLDTKTGAPTSQVADRCAVCTIEEAMTTATLAVISLVTGLGNAKVLDPGGPTGAGASPPKQAVVAGLGRRLREKRRLTRRTSLFMLGAALVAGGVGAFYLSRDEGDVGYPAVAAGGAFAVASGTMFVISGTY